jgi:hypothetical protein
VDNLIISAIEGTDLGEDKRQGPQSGLWSKIYDALNQLRAGAVYTDEAAKREGYYLKDIDDAIHASEH